MSLTNGCVAEDDNGGALLQVSSHQHLDQGLVQILLGFISLVNPKYPFRSEPELGQLFPCRLDIKLGLRIPGNICNVLLGRNRIFS